MKRDAYGFRDDKYFGLRLLSIHDSKTPYDNYPKAYIYYAGDKNQKKQLFQYDLNYPRLSPIYSPTYQQIKQKVNK